MNYCSCGFIQVCVSPDIQIQLEPASVTQRFLPKCPLLSSRCTTSRPRGTRRVQRELVRSGLGPFGGSLCGVVGNSCQIWCFFPLRAANSLELRSILTQANRCCGACKLWIGLVFCIARLHGRGGWVMGRGLSEWLKVIAFLPLLCSSSSSSSSSFSASTKTPPSSCSSLNLCPCAPHKSSSAAHVLRVRDMHIHALQKTRMRESDRGRDRRHLAAGWKKKEEGVCLLLPCTSFWLCCSLAPSPELLRRLRHQNTQWGMLARGHTHTHTHTYTHSSTISHWSKMHQQESLSSDSLSGKYRTRCASMSSPPFSSLLLPSPPSLSISLSLFVTI